MARTSSCDRSLFFCSLVCRFDEAPALERGGGAKQRKIQLWEKFYEVYQKWKAENSTRETFYEVYQLYSNYVYNLRCLHSIDPTNDDTSPTAQHIQPSLGP